MTVCHSVSDTMSSDGSSGQHKRKHTHLLESRCRQFPPAVQQRLCVDGIAVPTYMDDGVEFVKVDMYDHNDTLWYFAAFGLYRLYNVGNTSVLYDIKEAIRVSKGAWSRHNHVIRG